MFTDEPRARTASATGAAAGEALPWVLQTPPRSSLAATVLAALAIVAALWWGQRFVIPVAAGLMLAMLLAPFVVRAGRAVRSPALATVGALLLFVAALGAAASLFGGQLMRVADRVPEMISLAAQSLADADAGSQTVLTRARDALQDLDRAAASWTTIKANTKARSSRMQTVGLTARPGQAAIAVTLAASGATPFADGATVALKETAVSGSGVLLKFTGDLTIILFIAFFVLAGGPSLSNRFLELWAYHPRAREHAERALLECGRQVRLYAGVLLVTNVLVGLVVWGAFTIGGLPDAAGWGVAAAVLHVVPYVGMALLTALGAAEAFLAHGTLGAALGMGGALILVSTLLGTLVTAWLQGRAAKMNAAAVFIGLVFWGALWGLWGLFLGPILVVVLKVVAEHSRSGQRIARLLQG